MLLPEISNTIETKSDLVMNVFAKLNFERYSLICSITTAFISCFPLAYGIDKNITWMIIISSFTFLAGIIALIVSSWYFNKMSDQMLQGSKETLEAMEEGLDLLQISSPNKTIH